MRPQRLEERIYFPKLPTTLECDIDEQIERCSCLNGVEETHDPEELGVVLSVGVLEVEMDE